MVMKRFVSSILLLILFPASSSTANELQRCLDKNKEKPFLCFKGKGSLDKTCMIVQEKNVFTKQVTEKIKCF